MKIARQKQNTNKKTNIHLVNQIREKEIIHASSNTNKNIIFYFDCCMFIPPHCTEREKQKRKHRNYQNQSKKFF
jgi:hypothetical protein